MFQHLKPIRRIIKRLQWFWSNGHCIPEGGAFCNPDCVSDLFPPGNLLLGDVAEQTNGSSNQVEKML